ncbi:hypothetical protein PENTCL1PPCAC_2143 [Pristionchus entomophagus]|uniref:C2 domain-containing protein n=1 Tax=Pristionchus entomophagus TaxID=358040 RepID=A0AAV5SAI8_9BILA|nr:hypothetical protein PENTCL1PPCAC_2143 [Pristionchus entomophagus]
MGIDPVYSFPRVCDSTTAARPFLPGDISSRFHRVSMSEGDSKSIQVFGRCFTATIDVRRHTQRCPWCAEEVEKMEEVEEKDEEPINNIVILITMAALILILFIALVIVIFIAFCKKSPVASPSSSDVFRPQSKSLNQSITSSGLFSISGSSINTTVTIHETPVENEYESIKSPIPSVDSGFPV